MSRLPDSLTLGQKTVNVSPTLADQIVNWINPAAGQRRFEARMRMALLSGGYASADKSRRANQLGGRREMDADSAILPDLSTLREDSQNLARNNPIAAGALNTNIVKVVGTGLRVKPIVDRKILPITDKQADDFEKAAAREFSMATETREFDLERELPFSLLQGLVFLRALEDGDVLVNLPRVPRPGSPYATKLQIIEAARVCNRDFAADTENVWAGVEKDEYGAAEKYHVCSHHPGKRWFYQRQNIQLTWAKLHAFSPSGLPIALLLKDKTRPGQTRGVPYLAPVAELIKQLGRYTDAEVMAAVVSGMLTVFVYNESGNPEFSGGASPGFSDGQTTAPAQQTKGMELGYGSVLGLQDGQRVEVVNPGRPNTAFDPFFMAITRQIGMALGLPVEVLLKHFMSSYTAARAAFLDAWDYFYRRRHWLCNQFCQPVYETIITEAVLRGRLYAPGFLQDHLLRRAWLGSRWDGDAPGEIDPVKAVEAARGRTEMFLTTLDMEFSEMVGGDHETLYPQIIKEQKWIEKNKLRSAVTPAAPSARAVADQKQSRIDNPDNENKEE